MPWTDDTGPVPDRTEDELLALVRQKADAAVTARRRWQAGAATVVLLVAGLATVLARSGPDPATELRTVGSSPVDSTSTSLVTTTTAEVATTLAATTTTRPRPTSSTVAPPAPAGTATTRATAVPATTTTSLACRNSDNPACGPFRWDPPVGPNQPLTVAVTATPASPKAGGTVTFRVTVDDPDGAQLVSRDLGTVDYGDGTPVTFVSGHRDCLEGYGPWTPNPPEPIHAELTFEHVYAAAGTYTVTFRFRSLGNCTYGPSDGSCTATVTVAPA